MTSNYQIIRRQVESGGPVKWETLFDVFDGDRCIASFVDADTAQHYAHLFRRACEAEDRENASDDLLRHTRERLVMLPDCAWESLGITPTQAKIVRAAFDVAATVREYDEGDRCSFRCDLHRYAEFLECIKKGAQ